MVDPRGGGGARSGDAIFPASCQYPPVSHPVELLTSFRAPVRSWFEGSFAEPTAAQRKGWPPILAGKSTLLLAPTGSGKTLAAFLAALDHLMFDPVPPREQRLRLVYISPLKALGV